METREKTVFLHVKGDDYSALSFEQNFNMNEVYNQMVAEGVTFKVFEGDEYYIEVYIKEFGNIDPKFIDFIQDSIMDYDDSKHENFYKIKA